MCQWRVKRFLCGRWRLLTWSGCNSRGRDYLKVGFSGESKDSGSGKTRNEGNGNGEMEMVKPKLVTPIS